MILNRKRYPLGLQTFSQLIEGDYQYVDKTHLVYRMTHSDSKYIFLSRPRRFGKSLLVSTLKSYFEGRKDLFKGLAMEKLEQEWTEHPVLHFSMASAKYVDKRKLESELNFKLAQYEEIWGRGKEEIEPNQRLMGLIQRAYKKTGKGVVLLIDEYDAPLLDVAHEEEQLPMLREVMRNFYSPIKDCDPYLRFVFLTGITKFSQLSIFSELNNILNISMLEDYAALCGITEEEMLSQLGEGISQLAEKQGVSYDEAVQMLKDNYDGYHFTPSSPDIYNPFSLLNALADKKLGAYWFGSGTPTYLIEMLRKYGVSPSELCQVAYAVEQDFDAPTERMTSIIPLLYQSGYTTIKSYDPITQLYTLGIPNHEIRIGIMRSLLPNYLESATVQGNTTSALMGVALMQDRIDDMLSLLRDFLATVPATNRMNQPEHFEAHWQQMLFIVFSLLGAYCDVEVQTARGRVDMVARTATRLYLMELKMNQSAEAAMRQIDLKQYDNHFALCQLPVVKVGINFSDEQRNITDWEITPAH